MDQVYGVVPPVPVRVWEYAAPTVPSGNVEVDILTCALMVMLKALAFVLLTVSEALIVKFETEAVVGVPEMTPVPPFKDNPAGYPPVVFDQV